MMLSDYVQKVETASEAWLKNCEGPPVRKTFFARLECSHETFIDAEDEARGKHACIACYIAERGLQNQLIRTRLIRWIMARIGR